jgi:hypothetical protein
MIARERILASIDGRSVGSLFHPRDRRLVAKNAASLFQIAERKYDDDRDV